MACINLRLASAWALTLSACGSAPDSGLFDDPTAEASGGVGGDTLADSAPPPSGGDGGGSSDGDDSGGDGIKFDTPPDDGFGECGCGQAEWSYIFIANSGQGTVSKVDTRTVTEVGRYRTHPGAGDPSRTSVSLSGRAMAVANRNGGVTKVFTRPEFCSGATTSSGAGDIKAWGADDCVAWHTPFPQHDNQRPIAWAAGKLDTATCDHSEEKVWTSGCGPSDSRVWVHRLDGDTGAVEHSLPVPNFGCNGFGAYGGAVNADGDFWIGRNGMITGAPGIARIDFETLDIETYEYPTEVAGYGVTVDGDGFPWVSSWGQVGAARLDPATGGWDLATGPTFFSQGGIQAAADGTMWIAAMGPGLGGGMWGGPTGVVSVDPDTLEASPLTELPGTSTVKGISIDVDGFVWAVDSAAHKIDPDTLQVLATYSGLSGPYTYSDMTGWALTNTVCNPAG